MTNLTDLSIVVGGNDEIQPIMAMPKSHLTNLALQMDSDKVKEIMEIRCSGTRDMEEITVRCKEITGDALKKFIEMNKNTLALVSFFDVKNNSSGVYETLLKSRALREIRCTIEPSAEIQETLTKRGVHMRKHIDHEWTIDYTY